MIKHKCLLCKKDIVGNIVITPDNETYCSPCIADVLMSVRIA